MNTIPPFLGKKLLILGATAGEISLVQRAQKLGAYVIVTDNHEDWALAPAKNVADEAWNVSWSDLDTLEKYCRERGVDGITAGYSEFRVENLILLCKRLNLPCYCNLKQLEITRDKIKFKNFCRECGVPIVKEYATMDDVDEYPVIVKPVDRAGSIGVGIATNRAELEKACAYAYEMSVCKQIIIEKFIEKGTKIDFYFAVEKGEITLISSCDTINAKNNGFERVVQSAWLYPERRLNSPLSKTIPLDSLNRMIQAMEIEYGCIFFSGFLLETGETAFFECGFRLEGGHQYNYVEQKGPYNYLDLFIFHALSGTTEGLRKTPLNESLYAVSINLYAKSGIITDIRGVEEIAKMPDCCLVNIQARIGQKCTEEQAILQKIGMFQFVNASPKQLAKDVEKAYSLFGVFDETGRDMLYDRIDPSAIENWWTFNQISILKKDDSVSYESIQSLLTLSHAENIKHGLVYATASQSVDTLKKKIGDGQCFVAKNSDGAVVGTCTVEKRTICYWYVGGKEQPVLLVKLLAVHPDYKGYQIGKRLLQACIDYAKEHNDSLMVIDSAEQNIALRNLVSRFNFYAVDCCKYPANNFISTVYAKWLNGDCPWSEREREQKYQLHRNTL